MYDRFVEPQVFIIGETKIDESGLQDFLTEMNVPDWKTDASSDAEKLIEVAGKTCYMSFSTDLNKNLTRVGGRNNHDYLQEGLIKTMHGSVIEHASVSIVMWNVSRVVTHELIRHRAGTAFSQLSGRYVRNDEVKAYLPTCIGNNPKAVEVFNRAFEQMEQNVKELEDIFGINDMKTPDLFPLKKELTSAFRRIVGNGQANHIVVTGNHRAWRHMIEMRTSRHAEEEIRVVYAKVFDELSTRYPAIYADAQTETVSGIKEVVFKYSKV